MAQIEIGFGDKFLPGKFIHNWKPELKIDMKQKSSYPNQEIRASGPSHKFLPLGPRESSLESMTVGLPQTTLH
jgi:hypothetical protein